MTRSALLAALLAAGLAAACTSGGSNHLGNPLLWPAAALSSGLENAGYGAKRRLVSEHVHASHAGLIGEISGGGGGPLLERAMELAGVAPGRRAGLRALLQSDIALYQSDGEALVVALMVHGN